MTRRFVLVVRCMVFAMAVFATSSMSQEHNPPQPAPVDAASTPQPSQQPASNTPPQPSQPPQVESDAASLEALSELEKLKAQLKELERTLKPEARQDRDLNAMRENAERLQNRALEIKDASQPRINDIQVRLQRLGPPPQQGQPAEPEAIANERKALNARLTQLSAPSRAAEDLRWEAGQFLDRVNRQRRAVFTEKLLERVTSPLSPTLWREVIDKAGTGYSRLQFMMQVWWNRLFNDSWFYVAAGISSLIWLLFSSVALWGISKFRGWDAPEAPPFWRRAASSAWVVLFTALPPIVTVSSFYVLLDAFGLLNLNIDKILSAGVAAVCVIAIVNAIATTLLAPNKPQWRIFKASNRIAARIRSLSVGMAAVYGADLVMSALNEVVAAPLVLSIAQSVVATVAFAVLGLALFLTPTKDVEAEGTQTLRWLRFVRFPLTLVTLVILVSALVGYVALARFLAAQIVVTFTIFILLYLTFMIIDAFAESLKDDHATLGRWLRDDMGLDEDRRRQVSLPIMLVLKIAAFAVAIPLVMLQLGFDWGDVQTILGRAFFGFDIGNTRISPAAIAAAFIVFLIAYTIARLVQEWIDGQILAKAGLSGSARDSIRIGIGYVGVIIAGLIAFSSAGVSFSNLALVAGALSVGIGLGLQNIVNNFVSGLILLAERPIRVGDWVEIGTEEGIVRKISVRSTEVETFDRASIVIPNAMLIADKVKNWTRNNDIGRVQIPVSVAINSDPDHVRDILLRVASAHVEVLTTPAPIVYFENFTANSLDFKLYVYLLNLTRSFSVRTDLRIAILKAFKEENIQIPQSQVDIFLKDLQTRSAELAEALENTRASLSKASS